MTAKKPPVREPSLRRRLKLVACGTIAKRIVTRAIARHRDGTPPFHEVKTGFQALDEAAKSWWGVTLLVGTPDIDTTAAAAQIARWTAERSGRVLWFSLDDTTETAVFRLLTSLTHIAARRVFVERSLEEADWVRLEHAQRDLAELPFQLAMAHGASLGDLRGAISSALTQGPVELIILNGLEGLEVSRLSQLEELADDLGLAFLVVATVPPDVGIDLNRLVSIGALPLRPGSLVLHLGTNESSAASARSPETQECFLGFSRVASTKKVEVPLVRFIATRSFAQAEQRPSGV